MIRAGFLLADDRLDMIALARDGSAAHRLARRANALVLLDDGWSCEKEAKALFVDEDMARVWHRLFAEYGFDELGGSRWSALTEPLRASAPICNVRLILKQ